MNSSSFETGYRVIAPRLTQPPGQFTETETFEAVQEVTSGLAVTRIVGFLCLDWPMSASAISFKFRR